MIKFVKSTKKLFPGMSVEAGESILENTFRKTKFNFVELDQGYLSEVNEVVSTRLFELRFGKFLGFLNEIVFTEKIMRRYLRGVTKLGNFWILFRFSSVLVFLTLLITFSGGLSSKISLLDAIEITGVWTICEFAFSRSILAASRYQQLRLRLGIGLRAMTIASYISVWIELLILIVFCNLVALITSQNLFHLRDLFNLLGSLILLSILFIPISYIVARSSTKNTDARFLISPFFRILIILTPLFNAYHDEFPVLANFIQYNPSNLPFVALIDFMDYSTPVITSYLFTLIVLTLTMFFDEKIQSSYWRIVENK